MKSFFVIVICCLVIAVEAKPPPLRYDKTTVLKWSNEHFDQAVQELRKADSLRGTIPNLGARDNLHALIIGAVTGALSRNLKTTILNSGMSVLACGMSHLPDKYLEILSHLNKAEYHLEMARFYNLLSQKRHLHSDTSEGTKYLFYGISNLTRAIVYIESIHPDYGDITKNSLVFDLMEYRKEFMQNQKNLCDRSWDLYENFGEMGSELDVKFRKTIEIFLLQMHEDFLNAEQAWAKERHYKKR